MKIAIDISQVIYGTGVSRYTQNLIKNLLLIDKTNEYVLFGGSIGQYRGLGDIASELTLNKSNASAKIFPFSSKMADFMWNKLHLVKLEKLLGEIDVFHSSDWIQPPTDAYKVTTVHDLIPIKFPRMIHPKIVEVHKRKLAWVKKEVDRIIVPSNCTKNDLIEYGVLSEKITVISEANHIKKAKSDSVMEVKKRYNISGDYLLAFASAPYKNIERIIQAFDLACAGKNLKLVVVGRQSVNKIDERRGVRFTGYVDDITYSALLTGARALIFASTYEGFGIPILDAFACETPVVTSNLSSMPEVAGDAAILVDPFSVASIANGIKDALSSPKTLIQKGVKRLTHYSWLHNAEASLNIYTEAQK